MGRKKKLYEPINKKGKIRVSEKKTGKIAKNKREEVLKVVNILEGVK